jgi:TPR repeat protein
MVASAYWALRSHGIQWQMIRINNCPARVRIDKDRAFALLEQLTNRRYPAAFDNLGWLYLARDNIPQAVSHFRVGTQLGDPDSMVSLVEMYDKGHAAPRNQDETKIALLERAAGAMRQAPARSEVGSGYSSWPEHALCRARGQAPTPRRGSRTANR